MFVSRAPQADIERWKARMGWDIPWYTITDDFDADFGVDEWHGTNAFLRDGDEVFRTYFVDTRGDEALGSTWSYLDITALGRQEEWEDSPEGYPQTPPYGVVEPPRRVRADGHSALVIAHCADRAPSSSDSSRPAPTSPWRLSDEEREVMPRHAAHWEPFIGSGRW